MAKAERLPRKAPVAVNFDDDDDDTPVTKPAPKAKSAAERAADAEDDDDEYFKDDDDNHKPGKPTKDGVKKPAAKTGILKPPASMVHTPTDDRKLTNKDKKKLAEWKGANAGKMLDSFFARQAAEARKKFGNSAVYIGDQAKSLVIGIPCPAFAFEYLIAQDCYPLGLVMQIVAKHGVGKSGLLAEFGRWFNLAGGGLTLCENETKFNPHWYIAIMGDRLYKRMPLHRCTSVEDWQRHLTFAVKHMREDMIGTKEDPGPGKIFPALFGVDSIMGKMSEENQEKIMGKVGKKGKLGTTGEGFANARSYPIEAGSITKYMRTFPQLIDEWPFSLVMINHLRIKADDMGNKERNKTGGEQVNFQESFELEITKMGGHAKKIASVDFEGVPLMISCEKNSFGPTGRKIQTRILWWHEVNEHGVTEQKTVWDWDWATIHLLNNLLRGENQSTYYRSRLKDMDFHLECPASGDADNSAWSKSLGMTAKDAGTWAEVGAMIREDKKLLNKLRDALGICRRPILSGDYTEQMEKLAEELP